LTEAAVLIRLHVKPEFIDAFRAHTLELVRAARAEAGCQGIQVLYKPEEPAQLVLLERWADKEYYLSDAHQQSAHMQAYFEATQAMIADVGVEMLAPVEEVPRQEVHVDAA
jgi:quinol monooxygenase YgiN